MNHSFNVFRSSNPSGVIPVRVRFRSPAPDINEVRILFSISFFSDLSPVTIIGTVHEESISWLIDQQYDFSLNW